jgi:hypothetical protein
MKRLNLLLCCLLVIGCGEASDGTVKNNDTIANARSAPPPKIPPLRNEVKSEAVATHSEKTDNPLNDWYFSVKLYETAKTFHYLMKLKYEEIEGEDTLRLPDFGIMPIPVIKKGSDKYSCIVGFMDKDNQFREYKKVYVTNGELKVTTLKHYTVSTYSTSK